MTTSQSIRTTAGHYLDPSIIDHHIILVWPASMMKKKKQRLWIQNRRESEYHFGIASTNALSDGAEKLLYFYHFFYCYVWYCCFITFSDQLDGDLRQTSVNVVPFPRLHFFLCDPFPVHLIQTLDESRDDANAITSSPTDNNE
eukprot:830936_1